MFYQRRTTTSLFLKERLPGADGNLLHVGKFRFSGRVRMGIGMLRGFKRESEGVVSLVGLELLMTGSADPPLEEFGAAHAELQGISNRKLAQALAALVSQQGVIERMPKPEAA